MLYLLVTVAVSLLAAALAGLIRDRSRAALLGAVLAYLIFSAPWYAARAGLLGREGYDGEAAWWIVILLITILAAPVALTGSLTALVVSVLVHSSKAIAHRN